MNSHTHVSPSADPWSLWRWALVALPPALLSCNALLTVDADPVLVTDAGPPLDSSPSGETPDSEPCTDPTGFGGRGCYKCPPTNHDQLLNACVTYQMRYFDNSKRIPGFDPAVPRPPLASADAGTDATTDVGVDASGPSDASADAAPDSTPDSGPPGPPECPAMSTLSNPVILVSSTGLPLQLTLNALLVRATVLWKEVGSCDGLNSVSPGGPKATGTVHLYQTGLPAFDCTLPGTYPADLGGGGLYWDTCNPSIIQPSDFIDLPGPVNPVSFIVPFSSTQESISAEAAYRVYGFGKAAGVDPWVDESVLFRRNPTSANQTLVALSLGLPSNRLLGNDSNGGSKMIAAVSGASQAENALGFSSSEQTDRSRSTVRVLAVQFYGQRAAFFQDSDPGAYDRRPVRDGHYYFWIPMHVFARAGSTGDIVGGNPSLDALRDPAIVKDLAGYLTLRKPLPKTVDIFASLKDPGGGSAAIPQCAMHVTRRRDGGPLEPFTPPRSCDCAFEAAPPGRLPAECKACKTDGDCSGSRPVCSFGYCEAT